MADPALADSFNNSHLQNLDSKVDSMDPRKRMLYEIEQLLNLDDQDLEIETVRKKNCGSGRPRIPNRDIYRILKGLIQDKKVRPRFIYTGNSIMDFDEAEQLSKDADKQISELEPTI